MSSLLLSLHAVSLIFQHLFGFGVCASVLSSMLPKLACLGRHFIIMLWRTSSDLAYVRNGRLSWPWPIGDPY